MNQYFLIFLDIIQRDYVKYPLIAFLAFLIVIVSIFSLIRGNLAMSGWEKKRFKRVNGKKYEVSKSGKFIVRDGDMEFEISTVPKETIKIEKERVDELEEAVLDFDYDDTAEANASFVVASNNSPKTLVDDTENAIKPIEDKKPFVAKSRFSPDYKNDFEPIDLPRIFRSGQASETEFVGRINKVDKLTKLEIKRDDIAQQAKVVAMEKEMAKSNNAQNVVDENNIAELNIAENNVNENIVPLNEIANENNEEKQNDVFNGNNEHKENINEIIEANETQLSDSMPNGLNNADTVNNNENVNNLPNDEEQIKTQKEKKFVLDLGDDPLSEKEFNEFSESIKPIPTILDKKDLKSDIDAKDIEKAVDAFVAEQKPVEKEKILNEKILKKLISPNPPVGSFDEAVVFGKYEIYQSDDGSFRYYLYTNKNEAIYGHGGFKNIATVLSHINSFKRSIYEGEFSVQGDKELGYRFVLTRGDAEFRGIVLKSKDRVLKTIEKIKYYGITEIIRKD